MKLPTSCLGKCSVPLKAHVLDKVREPALVFVFEHRARIDDEPKLGARLRLSVLPDVVAEPVRERAYRNERIDRNGLVERGVPKVAGRSRLLSAGKADDRRHGEHGQQQTEAGAKSHAGIVPQPRADRKSLEIFEAGSGFAPALAGLRGRPRHRCEKR